MSQPPAASGPANALQLSAVPTLSRYLRQLLGLLDLAQAQVDAGLADEATLLATRLAPDMLPLGTQVLICGNFIPRMQAVLRGAPVQFPDWPTDLASLGETVRGLIRTVEQWTPADFENPDRVVTGDAGQATLQMPLRAWIHEFALPNFFFHLSTVYLLLRQQGLPLGKAQFDGLHRYG
jgi:hypothetical protein